MTSEKSLDQPTEDAAPSTTKTVVQLKRQLGLFSAVNTILAVMIGSGIFVSSSSALRYSGSVGMCIIVWTACGFISLLGALAYAELGSMVPRSGAEYAYFMDSFGPLHKFWGRLPAFLFSFIMVLIVRPAEVAVIVLTFSEYVCEPVFSIFCISSVDDRAIIKKIVAIVTLGIISYINLVSVKLYVKITNIFSSFKVLVCAIIIVAGIYEICIGNTKNLQKGFEGTKLEAADIALAFYSGLWAYDGWSAVTGITEEIRHPEVNILRSILIGVPLVTILYVFMNVAYMAVIPIPVLTNVPAVAVEFGKQVLGPMQFVVPLGVALSTFGCALSLQFGVTRLCYVAGQDGHIMECLSFIHSKLLTPGPAVVLQGTISLIFIISGGILDLIEFASFLIWMFYAVAMVSLLVMRRNMKNVHRPYRVPTWVPIFVIFVAVFLSVTPVVMEPTPKYLFALLFVFLGVLNYYWFIYKHRQPKWMGKVTYAIQLLFEAVPSNPQVGISSDKDEK